ncbi:unnamed protein product, partial [Mesorhabditis belari]|uniref:Uncharacterized protein n=1 Tax=Mesorhabditis belari TaxID=2138241 RepID=A0AAF3J3K1_9BILA
MTFPEDFIGKIGKMQDRRAVTSGHVCTACHNDIIDAYYMRVQPNMEFHSTCLKCVECQRFLDESGTTFIKDGRTYCKDDYYRRFGQKCTRCARFCTKNEMVMRARHLLFHADCFCCASCERRLCTGDQYTVRTDGVFCAPECQVPSLTPLGVQLPNSLPTSLVSLPTNNNNTPAPLHENRISSPSCGFDEDSWETSTLASGDGGNTTSPPLSLRSPKSDEGSTHISSGKKSKKDKQTTRVRTVLNEAQLGILKKCYAMNARPDALLKEQLVELTGLNARVIRVWFQNKRCKDKKRQIQLRDMQVNAEKEAALSGIRLHGVGPLIAVSPSSHLSDLTLPPPLDIHHFAQWPQEHQQQQPFHQPHHLAPFSEDHQIGVPIGLPPPGFVSPLQFPQFSSPSHHSHMHPSDLASPSCSE